MSGKVIIIGSINVDIVARADRLPVAGETVAGGDIAVMLGGKGANQAVAAARAGAAAALVGAVGQQSFGLRPLAMLDAYGVETGAVRQTEGPTGAALITVDAAGENLITVSPGANARLAPADLCDMTCDIALAQLETPRNVTVEGFRAVRRAGGRTVLNAAPALPVSEELAGLTDILIVNETELAHYAGSQPRGTARAIAEDMRAVRRFAGQCVIATLGAEGVLALVGDDVIAVPAVQAEQVVDTTGAGDCFCGALAAALAGGMELAGGTEQEDRAGVRGHDALRFAAAAASLAVEQPGAAPAMPDRHAIDRRLRG